MAPRMQTAGMSGIIAGLAILIGFALFFYSQLTPAVLSDPAKTFEWVNANLSRLRLTTAAFLIGTGFAVVFVAGLAEKLRARTPTRATATLYLALLGLAGYGIGGLIFWRSLPALAATGDQVAASHAWVAAYALDQAVDGFGNLFTGLATLFAGWAIIETKVLNSTLGWFGLLSGVVAVLAFLVPGNDTLSLGTFILPAVWLIWGGSALRRAM